MGRLPFEVIGKFMLEHFALRAVLAGLFLAAVAAPFGCVVVWRRMAYFGETIAQAGLVGVAFAVMLSIDPMIGVFTATLLMAAVLARSARSTTVPIDSLLGISAHALLAVAIVMLSVTGSRLDLQGLLFGDLLSVSRTDLAWIGISAVLGLATMGAIWKPLVALSVHAELAQAEGADVEVTRMIFLTALALVVAVGIKIVGALLTIAFLLVPAAAARPLARTPEQMAGWAAVLGGLGVIGGLALSFYMDTPAGASIVVVLAALFLLTSTIWGNARRALP